MSALFLNTHSALNHADWKVRLARLDWYLLTVVLALMSFGLVMILSASIDLAAHSYKDPWFFFKRHALYLCVALVGAIMIFSLPSQAWNRLGIVFLIIGIALLVAVLIPGVGKMVNGSRRWLGVGPFSLQASEAAKFCFIVFFASFLSRRTFEFKNGWSAFFKLLVILGAFVILLLLEPDFGSSVVLCITAGAMMFIAGVPVLRFVFLALLAVVGLAFMAVASPYRWQRLVTFLDPWADQFSSGYQLVQSLIAFGRGEWFGLGLGNSLQKLFFLPEAHTDFIFSIVAEEFGLIGALVLVACFVILVWRILLLAFKAYKQEAFFASYCAMGVAMLFSAQAFINMGVASGLLPTKGLTLPFVSSGGSSLLVCTALIALVLRLGWELNDE
ncbi:putative lipid II flippase FtsW [Marinagarivorans algicola]|uniref:putative lipid II flippase FtsW n=1 Tax=Marinagarivorans algicola TaxID=1513270 RepID=UPI0009E66543|nr:putative lipid II flippase FtsW [Marinagarivorans algicola]